MSIPRLAIHRPVTMFMISAVITLLGVISLSRLPVDLMPEFEQPTLNFRTSYAGFGPLEIEELITRPMEQAVSAVPGIPRVESSSSEANSQIRLNFEWGSDLSEAADDARTRVDRLRTAPPSRRARPADDLQVRLQPAAGLTDWYRGRLRPGHAPRGRTERNRSAVRARGRRGRRHRERRRSTRDPRRPLQGKDHGPEPVGEPGRQCPALGEPEHAAWRNLPGRRHVPRPQPGTVPEH